MSWGAFNICSEGHSIHHNVDQAAGAKYGVRYPYKFDDKGLRFWATNTGTVLDHGRLGRSWGATSWLHKKNESPTPEITFEKHGEDAPDPAIHIKTLAGWDVSDSTDEYFASFHNQCDRLWIGQNARHSLVLENYALNAGTGDWLHPAQVSKSDMLSDPDYYKCRPFMPPTMPYDAENTPGSWPKLQTKRGMREWVKDGWAYKKDTDVLNNHGPHEFGWPDLGDPEWDDDGIWDVSPNPTANLDKNLLYLMEKLYEHGPACTCDPVENPRDCNDRILTGYRPHYWVKSSGVPQHYDSSKLLESWCVEDDYPYGGSSSQSGYYMAGWPPYSISCGETSFQRRRNIDWNTGSSYEPYYAKTDQYSTGSDGPDTVSGYAALCEMIPPNTAFDLIIYLQVVNYIICEREPPYNKVASGYFNTKCYCILHQIAPLLPKP